MIAGTFEWMQSLHPNERARVRANFLKKFNPKLAAKFAAKIKGDEQDDRRLSQGGWVKIEDVPDEWKDGRSVLFRTDYGLQTTMKFNKLLNWDGETEEIPEGGFVRELGCRRCSGMGLGSLSYAMLPTPPQEEA